jgi:putative ABC transport system ATP-binding protein
MNLLGCLDSPTQGRYWLDGMLVSRLSRDQRALIRNRKIGFVFQSFNLLPRATSLKNVVLPLLYAGVHGKRAERLAYVALERVGLADRREILTTLQGLNQAGMTILLVTHEPDIAAFCRRTVSFQDGRLVEDRHTLTSTGV